MGPLGLVTDSMRDVHLALAISCSFLLYRTLHSKNTPLLTNHSLRLMLITPSMHLLVSKTLIRLWKSETEYQNIQLENTTPPRCVKKRSSQWKIRVLWVTSSPEIRGLDSMKDKFLTCWLRGKHKELTLPYPSTAQLSPPSKSTWKTRVTTGSWSAKVLTHCRAKHWKSFSTKRGWICLVSFGLGFCPVSKICFYFY